MGRSYKKQIGRTQLISTRTNTSSGCSRVQAFEFYKHQQLHNNESSIRLLTVQPGTGQISCTISSVLLRSCPPYKALSYTWGIQPPKQIILINGLRFRVRDNLWLFLSQFRRENCSWRIWIDAICVDQHDLDERGQQVQLMKSIYTQAREVIAWLGVEPNGMAHELEHRSIPDSSSTNLRWCAAVSRLVNVSYWDRAWVVQELVLARRVFLWFGAGKLELPIFQKWYEAAQEKAIFESNMNLDQILARKYGSVQDETSDKLEDMICAFADTKCKDPRDKVYAFLSLQRPGGRGESIKPDYNISGLELFFDVVETLDMTNASLGHRSFADILQKAMDLNADQLRHSSQYKKISRKTGIQLLHELPWKRDRARHKYVVGAELMDDDDDL